MNEYYATINLPECPRGEKASFPDTPRTAVLVGNGVLVPVTRSIMGRAADLVPVNGGPTEPHDRVDLIVSLDPDLD